jgi:hypothetical protein
VKRRRRTRRDADLTRRKRSRIDADRRALDSREAVRWRVGVVTDDSPLSVAIGGTAAANAWIDVRRVSSYTPTPGDVVVVLVRGNDAVVVGEIV